MPLNSLGQPIGQALPEFRAPAPPPRTPLHGRSCTLVPLDPSAHGEALFHAFSADLDGRLWTYLSIGPFGDASAYRAAINKAMEQPATSFLAVLDEQGAPVGVIAWLRIQPESACIEIGHVCFSPALQRTRAATEALALMLKRCFDDLGYRRCEWKCDDLNMASRRAAERLGFTYEGTFRQATVYKGRNRDTAWYAILDRDWPALRRAFDAWLDPSNFDGQGQQRRSLAQIRGGA
jgi:RimJ/RimL family protein N-acetyltransferase